MDSKQIIDEAMRLSPAERFEIAQELWDSVADEPDAWKLSDDQVAELNRRLADLKVNPDNVTDWQTIKSQVLNRK